MRYTQQQLINLIRAASNMSLEPVVDHMEQVYTIGSCEGEAGEQEPAHDFYFNPTPDGMYEVTWLS